jgi:hypothetical protein
MDTLIGGIPVTAPLWRGATRDKLLRIIELMSDASYHYADDSGKEWGRARECKNEAAALINQLRLDYAAIKVLYEERQQLVSFENLVDAVLKDARK